MWCVVCGVWKRRWICGIRPIVYRLVAACPGSWALATVLKIGEKPRLDVVIVMTQWRCTSCLGGSRAPGKLVGRSLLVSSNGVEWWWWLEVASVGTERWLWLRVTSIGVEGWTQVVQCDTEEDGKKRESEREEFDEHFAPLSLLRIMAAFDSMSSWYSAGNGWCEPFDSRSGHRRGSWRTCSEDEWYWLTCSAEIW